MHGTYRRKFHEIVITFDKEALKTSRAVIGFNYCEQFYAIEKKLRKEYSQDQNYYKKRQETRLKKSSKVLQDFFKTYIETELPEALPKSPLGKALAYTRKLLPSFGLFLEDGALEIDNNGAERGIKPFVIGRKNWLFSNTKKGALSSATIYSIIETAKANHLLVEKYLIYLMDIIANRDPLDDEDDLLKAMPWSEDLPDYLKIENSK